MSVRHSSARSSMVPPCHWWMRRRNPNPVRAGAAAPVGAGDQDADRPGRPVCHRKARLAADQAVDPGAPLQRDTRGRTPFAALAKQEGVSPSYFTRLVRLSYLAPDITQAILDGRQPSHLTADK